MAEAAGRRMARAARRRGLVLAVVVAALSSACGGIPRDERVTAVRPVEAAQDRAGLDRGPRNSPVFLRFPPPAPQAAPEQIVRGFLDAHADVQPDLRIARQYLAPGTRWDPDAGVTVFSGDRIVSEPSGTREDQTATVTVTRVATVTRSGEYVPRRDAAPTVLRLRMRLVDGQYRLVDVPPGLLLSQGGLERAFRRSVVYFPDRLRRALVPDLLFLRRGATSDVTSVAQRLVVGPSPWLAPAVRTAVPRGTAVRGTVSVLRGTATVNLSRHAQDVAPGGRASLVAQIVWTITEPGLGVDAVRILVDGRDIVLLGGSTRRPQRRSDWAAFDPDPADDTSRLYFLRGGRLHSVDRGATAPVRDDPNLREIATTRSGALVAAVRDNRDGSQSLLVGALSGELTARLQADRIGSPTWEPGDEWIWAIREAGGRRDLVAVPTAGGPVVVVGGAVAGVVEQVAVAPTGARAVLVVRRGRIRQASIAHVVRVGQSVSIGGLRPLRPDSASVGAMTWETSTRLVLADQSGIFRVDVDGFDPTEVPSEGLPPTPVDHLAAGPSVDLVAGSGGALWRRAAGWRPAGPGTSPAYAG